MVIRSRTQPMPPSSSSRESEHCCCLLQRSTQPSRNPSPRSMLRRPSHRLLASCTRIVFLSSPLLDRVDLLRCSQPIRLHAGSPRAHPIKSSIWGGPPYTTSLPTLKIRRITSFSRETPQCSMHLPVSNPSKLEASALRPFLSRTPPNRQKRF